MDISVIAKGGPVMIPLLLLSIYALAVIFYKMFQFFAAGVYNHAFIDPIMTYVKRGELSTAEDLLKKEQGPVARIMQVAIACITNRNMSIRSREAEISRIGTAELRQLESHMRGLELVSTTSPLLGLLGTVMGMVAVFATIGSAGSRVDPSLLADGIWEALITTVAGLIIAVPAVMAYYLIDGVIEKLRVSMKDVTIQIMALEDEYIRNEKEQEKRERLEHEKKIIEMQRAQEEAARTTRTTPQSSSTLRLLNPSYTQM